MTEPFDEREDIIAACRYILKSNGVGKKGRAFVMQALGRLEDRELNSVYWSLMNVDERLNNLPTAGTPRGFSLGTTERDPKTHIAVEADRNALCGVHIIDRQRGPELTPQEAQEHSSCKQCQYAVKLYEPYFL
jgi:hypothetical protein